MSLPVVGVTSLAGAMGHWRGGNVRLRTAIPFGIVAMLGAYAGARIAAYLTGKMQLVLLAIVMVAAALSMFRSSARDGANLPSADTGIGAAPVRAAQFPLLVLVGFCVGLLTGLLGIGGGFLVVPALVVLGGVPIAQAVGTSLVVIAANCATAFAGYAGHVTLPWRFVATFALVAAGGGVAGSYLARFMSQRTLKHAFALFLLAMAALIFANNWRNLRRDGAGASGQTSRRSAVMTRGERSTEGVLLPSSRTSSPPDAQAELRPPAASRP
jgi:hypothetical protein